MISLCFKYESGFSVHILSLLLNSPFLRSWFWTFPWYITSLNRNRFWRKLTKCYILLRTDLENVGFFYYYYFYTWLWIQLGNEYDHVSFCCRHPLTSFHHWKLLGRTLWLSWLFSLQLTTKILTLWKSVFILKAVTLSECLNFDDSVTFL